jgi:uncharacterized membrane protein
VQRLKNLSILKITQEADVYRKMKRLSKRADAILGTLLLLCATSHFSVALAIADSPVTFESLTLTAYLDGFVQVNYQLTLNQTYPTINVSLIGETREEILMVDEQNLPLDYTITNNEAVIYSLNATKITITYFTQDLTAKTGKYWTLTADAPTNATVTLPATVSIISINKVPELIENANGQIILVMPSGTIDVTYIAEHDLGTQTQNPDATPLIITAVLLSAAFPIIVSVIYLVKRKKTPLKPTENKNEVDTKKLLEKHKDLRQEEIQVISFLTEKHGTALEAELYEKLNLPRTTTWRLLKRLQTMGIIDITKARRQNTISIKKKYLKK